MVLFSEKCTVRLDGKTAIVTGSNTGIGKETVKDLYKRGAYVIMACRNVDKAEEAAKEIVNSCKTLNNVGKIATVELNLCSLKSVRECSEKILSKQEKINILINNAGIMSTPYGKTDDGFEQQFGTNHLGHFLFTLLLLPNIINGAPARIVNVSSMAHEWGKLDLDDINWKNKKYSAVGAYGQSKLCNVLFTAELQRRLKDANIEGVSVYSLHPGVIATELGRHLDNTFFKGLTWITFKVGKFWMKTPLEGAQTTLYCAIDEKAGTETGLYYSDCKPKKPSRDAQNIINARKLWNTSLDMVNLTDYNILQMNEYIEY